MRRAVPLASVALILLLTAGVAPAAADCPTGGMASAVTEDLNTLEEHGPGAFTTSSGGMATAITDDLQTLRCEGLDAFQPR